MDQPPRKINVTGAIFAALIVVFIFGFFVGLPVFAWVLLVAAFIGLWVATAGKRGEDWGTKQPPPDRPWRAETADEE
ncbi:hypothetical protein ACFYWN_44815 [Streptomyces sp. NPDC002917]|uniref:hypothetical protein n=1 Tax=Streptomyces sp. NPDC002917 TaxID=3364671 RepID=UPI0036957662